MTLVSGRSLIAMTYADGILYTSRGYRAGPYMAIRMGGSGDVNDSGVLWRVPTGAPYIASILHYDGLIYMANGNGISNGVGVNGDAHPGLGAGVGAGFGAATSALAAALPQLSGTKFTNLFTFRGKTFLLLFHSFLPVFRDKFHF